MAVMSVSAVAAGGVSLHRHASLPSVELLSQHKGGGLSLYSTDFALVVPDDWEGTVFYRARGHRLAPGQLLCVEPGEVVVSVEARNQGRLRVLLLGAELVREMLLLRGRALPETIPAVFATQGGTALAAALVQMFGALERRASVTELGVCVETLVEALVDAIVRAGKAPLTRSRAGKGASIVEQLRETLMRGANRDEPPPDLATLSREVGLSRFQTLRLFRRHYGVTPRAFHLHISLALARRSLKAGASLAEVAASCGFVDQSHFTRQFKRLLGVTPGQYARTG
jgi:AraC-like DNA-binding protein